nr:unnamed protein product [Callosobruchus analis]
MGNSINDLKAAIVSLQNQIKSITTNNTSANVSQSQFEDIVQEVFERENRKCNVIIFGMREQEAADKNDRHALEKTDVMKVVTHVSSSVTVNSIRRIGRYDSSRTTGRPVKVTLTSPEEVHELLRKTPNLKKSDAFRKISIFADKTPRQMEHYKTIKKELEDRISNGETNIRIKYVNGTPRIVNF